MKGTGVAQRQGERCVREAGKVFQRRLYGRNSSCSVHLQVAVCFSFTFPKKTVANPQTLSSLAPSTQGVYPRGVAGLCFLFPQVPAVSRDIPSCSILGPETNISALQASAHGRGARCCFLGGGGGESSLLAIVG